MVGFRLPDLIRAGARIERADPLRPSTSWAAEHPAALGTGGLFARMIWSRVLGGAAWPRRWPWPIRLALSVAGFIQKPFSQADLLAKIREVVARSQNP
jgi:hypothetical protein